MNPRNINHAGDGSCCIPGIGEFHTREYETQLAKQKVQETDLINKAQRSKKPLYAICYWHRKNGRMTEEFLYCHAEDGDDARSQYFNSTAGIGLSDVRIVAIAPVVGYNVADDHGERLFV